MTFVVMISIPDHITRLYLDTNIFIYLLEGSPTFREPVARLIEEAGERGMPLFTSEIAICECRLGAHRRKDTELISLYDAFFDESAGELEIISASSEVLWNAPELAGALGLKIMDALHVSCALVAGCDGFLTNDRAIPSVKGELEVIPVLGE